MVEELVLRLASAVGGISGLLAVMIYVQSRKDLTAAQASYERLVTRMAGQSESNQQQLVEVVSNNTAAMQMQTESNRALCNRLSELEREVQYQRRNHEKA
ncbi:MAG TPA: hypothetical protein VMY40_09520 [Anaerolineae bacterium]|nr:hypothetical protein [Anaerolineae bacterium]